MGKKKKEGKGKREAGLSSAFFIGSFALLEYWNFLSTSLKIAVLSPFSY